MTYKDKASYGSLPPFRDPTKRLFYPVKNKNSWGVWCTGWRRPIGCLKLQVIFRKRPTNYRVLLRKMTCEDKASCGSSPLCRRLLQYYWYHFPVLHILFFKRSSTGTVIGTNWEQKWIRPMNGRFSTPAPHVSCVPQCESISLVCMHSMFLVCMQHTLCLNLCRYLIYTCLCMYLECILYISRCILYIVLQRVKY